jgi:hypothetical protein
MKYFERLLQLPLRFILGIVTLCCLPLCFLIGFALSREKSPTRDAVEWCKELLREL